MTALCHAAATEIKRSKSGRDDPHAWAEPAVILELADLDGGRLVVASTQLREGADAQLGPADRATCQPAEQVGRLILWKKCEW